MFTTTYDIFRQLLIEARKQQGMTQMQVAEALGKPQSYVSKYERGERRLDVIEFLRLARVLDLDPCEVLRSLGAGR